MDTLSIIVLTAVINALVTAAIGGIVLYRIQKRIDNSYYEHQTKFSRNYAKQVETLEGLYRKFIDFNDKVEGTIHARRWEKATMELDEWMEKKQYVTDLLDDFSHYFDTNRLFIPARLADSIIDISSDATVSWLMLSLGLSSAKADETLRLNWSSNDPSKPFTVTLDKGKGIISYNNPESLIESMRNELKKQARFLENLYKLVADIETK